MLSPGHGDEQLAYGGEIQEIRDAELRTFDDFGLAFDCYELYLIPSVLLDAGSLGGELISEAGCLRNLAVTYRNPNPKKIGR
jgi:hypothetical protein